MNYKLVFRVLGRLLLVEAALMLPSLVVSLIFQEGDEGAFLIAMGLTALCGGSLALLLKPKHKDLTPRDGIAVAALVWVVYSFFGALPFVFSGAIPRLVDAYFETVSGFTTTGSTILPAMENLPHGILFWRTFTHWVGGMGVLIFTLAFMPRLSGKTSHIARAESAGPTFSKLLPKMSDTAKMLYGLYLALTVVLILCLLPTGMNVFDTLIHAFGTAGTGGFSNYNLSVGGMNNPAAEWVLALFMVLFGVSFAIYFHLVRKEFDQAINNKELWVYVGIVVVATLLITLNIRPHYDDFFSSLRYAFFQVSAIISTTGFATADFNLWPTFSKAILLVLMCIGGCAGSTAGGFKLSRLMLIVKAGFRELQRALQPRKVAVVRLEGKPVAESTLSMIGVYLFFLVGLELVGGLLISLETADVTTAFTAALTCLSNVGPGLSAIGPMGNFSFFSAPTKILLSFLMLAGRLEVFPMLLLFAPSMWKKN